MACGDRWPYCGCNNYFLHAGHPLPSPFFVETSDMRELKDRIAELEKIMTKHINVTDKVWARVEEIINYLEK